MFIAGVPVKVSDLYVINITNGNNVNFTLRWGEPFNNLDPVIMYQVSCSGDAPCPQSYNTTNNHTRSHTFTDFTPNSYYTFSVVAINSIGSGEAGVVMVGEIINTTIAQPVRNISTISTATTTSMGKGMTTTTSSVGMATTSSEGMTTTTSSEGMTTTTSSEGMTTTTSSVGMTTTTSSEGMTTTTSSEGMTTATSSEGMTTTSSEGMTTTTSSEGMTATTSSEGMTTTTSSEGMTTATSSEGMTTATLSEGMTTTSSEGKTITT